MFESFWLNVRFRGQSIKEKFPGASSDDQRALAARAFEMWRQGRLVIDYDRNELLPAA